MFIYVSSAYTDCNDPTLDTSGYSGGCVEVEACGTLNQANTYYLLNQSVSSTHICFSAQANNMVLDLNEYTITYGTENNADPSHAVYASACWEVSNGNRPCGGSAEHLIIKNGKIVQGDGTTQYSHAIFVNRINTANNVELYGLNITVKGNSAKNIVFTECGRWKVHDNVLYSEVTEIINRHAIDGLLIDFQNTIGGDNWIYNNILKGGAQGGIRMSGPNLNQANNKIFNNSINHGCPTCPISYSNDFGIYAWFFDLQVYDNHVHTDSGRGIAVMYGDSIDVFNNTVETKTLDNNLEYGGCPIGGTYGIQLDEDVTNAIIHDNDVTTYADHCDASGLRITSIPYGNNNTIYNNTFRGLRTGDMLGRGHGFTVISGQDTSGQDGIILDNTFIGDTATIGRLEGYVSNIFFQGNTFVRGPNPSDFFTFDFGKGYRPAVNLTFIDPIFGEGTSSKDFYFHPVDLTYEGNTHEDAWWPSEYFINRTLIVDVQDNGVPVGLNEADVVIIDNQSSTVYSGQTDVQGQVETILAEFKGYNTETSGTEIIEFSPYSISVTYNGETLSRLVFLNESKTELFEFGLSPCLDGEVRVCGVTDVGICVYGNQTCVGGSWTDCVGNIDPVVEVCDNAEDDDCDGMTDYEDIEDCTLPECSLLFDLYPCNCIDFNEVISSINGWYADSITLTELINALKLWKAGC